ncbi:MAG: hypothetical protein M3295_05430 [Chloroflexota bacterium]|nr:hypothetical protein [Chloroflexota bacterium]
MPAGAVPAGAPPPGYVAYGPSRQWQYRAPGDRKSGLSAGRLILIFVVVLVVILAVGAVLVFLLQPKPVAPECPDPSQACGIPPQPPSDLPALVTGTTWSSGDLGFAFEYDGELWTVNKEDGRSVELLVRTQSGAVTFGIQGASAAEANPQSLLDAAIGSLDERVLGLTAEADADRQPLGNPIVGYVDGVGGVYRGTLDSPQGPGSEVSVAVLAASDGQVSLVVTIVTPDELRDAAFSIGDSMMNTLRWPSEAQ